ncbi:hypothetical protein L1887_37122 [Cichorium endivia]|nr:hypothetical protein L1887_37122 [Cichorium endivia]
METEMSNGAGPTGRCLRSFVDEGSTESHNYYLSRRTLLEMLRDRGCDTSNSDIELILQQFRDLHGQVVDVDLLRISASRVSEPDNKVTDSSLKLFPILFESFVEIKNGFVL